MHFRTGGGTRYKILYWDRVLPLAETPGKASVQMAGYPEDVEIDQRELSWFLEGLDLGEILAHEKLSYATLL